MKTIPEQIEQIQRELADRGGITIINICEEPPLSEFKGACRAYRLGFEQGGKVVTWGVLSLEQWRQLGGAELIVDLGRVRIPYIDIIGEGVDRLREVVTEMLYANLASTE